MTTPEQIRINHVFRADRPTRVEVVKSDARPTFLVTLLEEDRSTVPSQNKVIDLANWAARGLIYKCWKTETGEACGVERQVVNNEVSRYFSLPRQETQVLAPTSIVAVSPGVDLPAAVQPDDPQLLLLRVTNLVTAGTVTISGHDADGEEQAEIITIGADGDYQSVIQYRGITEDGINAIGEYDLEVYIYQGEVLVTLEPTDIAEPGLYGLTVELVENGGNRSTFPMPIFFHVWDKRTLPPPVILSFDTDQGVPGDPIIITGTGFFDVSVVNFLDTDTGEILPLDNLVVVSDTEINGDVPAGADGGLKRVTATSPAGTGEPASFTVLPFVSAVTDPASPGDTLTIDGLAFTLATGATIAPVGGGVPVVLTSFTVVDPTQVTGVVPAGTALGDYELVVAVPGNTSNPVRVTLE